MAENMDLSPSPPGRTTSGPTAVVNQEQYEYNSCGQRAREYQAHDGAVTSSTSPSVQYTYGDGAVGGVAKYVWITGVIYRNGRGVQYGHGTTGAIDAIMSRLSSISDRSLGDTVDCTYLGRGSIVKETHPSVAGGWTLDYDPTGNRSSSGLDRFGRVVDQRRANDAATAIDPTKRFPTFAPSPLEFRAGRFVIVRR